MYLPLYVIAANKLVIMQIIVLRMASNQISPETNQQTQQLVDKKNLKINQQTKTQDHQATICQILFVIVVIRKVILLQTVQILVKMGK